MTFKYKILFIRAIKRLILIINSSVFTIFVIYYTIKFISRINRLPVKFYGGSAKLLLLNIRWRRNRKLDKNFKKIEQKNIVNLDFQKKDAHSKTQFFLTWHACEKKHKSLAETYKICVLRRGDKMQSTKFLESVKDVLGPTDVAILSKKPVYNLK